MKFSLLNWLFFCLIVSCTGLSVKEKIIDNYYLVAADDEDELSLTYHKPNDGDNYGTIIGATVFAVGYNNKYIIVQQHPRKFPNSFDKKVTNFYILPLKEDFDWKTNNGLIGPLNLVQFNNKKRELKIPDNLKFTLIKENLR